MLRKGISQLISAVIVILLVVTAISLVLTLGSPTINKARESMIVNEAVQNMRVLDDTVREVASESLGSRTTVQLKVTDGTYNVNEKTNDIEFEYMIKYGTFEPGTYLKDGNLIMATGASSKASEYDLNGDGENELVLENEILRIGILKSGTRNNFAAIDTSKLIKILNFKETNSSVVPSDSSIVLDDIYGSSIGFGYSELVQSGNHLPKAEAIAHVESTYLTYDVLYTLQSGADFLTVKIMNASYK